MHCAQQIVQGTRSSDAPCAPLAHTIWFDTLVHHTNTLSNLDPVAPSESGCCADTLRRHSGDGTSLDIDLTFIADLFEDTDWAYATHTFDVYDGIAYMMVQYEEPALGSEVKVDAVVAMDLATEEVVKTADGLSYFSLYDNLETTSVESSAGVFKIQHYSKSGRLQPGPGPSR